MSRRLLAIAVIGALAMTPSAIAANLMSGSAAFSAAGTGSGPHFTLAKNDKADKDKGKGGGQGKGHPGKGKPDTVKRDNARGDNFRDDKTAKNDDRQNRRFADDDRRRVEDYYRNEYRSGRCPPGLDRKNNGCLPPGQAKRNWASGQHLPPDLAYHDVPRPLYDVLSPPPYGYRYVQVYGDVLLIEVATRLVIDLVTVNY